MQPTKCTRSHSSAWPLIVATFLAAWIPLQAVPRSVSAQVTAEQANQAIDRGVSYLKNQYKINNNRWPEYTAVPGGISGLCTLALLQSGLPASDPTIQQSLEQLRSMDNLRMVYARSLVTMVLCAADPKRDRLQIKEHVRWLQEAQVTQGPHKGGWSYSNGKTQTSDPSNSQFALMALHEAEEVGIAVDKETFQSALDYWLKRQDREGGWRYQPELAATLSMTCAGISSLVIASGKLGNADAQIVNNQVDCCGNQSDEDALQRGIDYLGRKLRITSNLYYLYALERVGRLTGRRFLGRNDWYRMGSEMLVKQQDPLDGHWKGSGVREDNKFVATSLALLFLSKGRRPVVVAQMKHGSSESTSWNHHRHAVHHLTQHIESLWKRDLSWQTISIQSATLTDLMETPVLFISGSESLDLDKEQKENLRDYVNQGGFILAEAACNNKAFDSSFRALMKELFPESPLRVLPPDHAIWFAQEKIAPRFVGTLEGVNACCRTSVVYSRIDLSCYWELNQRRQLDNYPAPIREEVEQRTRLGGNIIAYATNRELKDKLDRPELTLRDKSYEQPTRGTLVLPKLSHPGGSDDAPHALANLLTLMRVQFDMRVGTQRRLLAATDELYKYPILFIHGRRAFRFTAQERKALAQYLQRGGTIFGDSICASPEFAQSFRREMQAIFNKQSLVRIPPDHPLFSTDFGGYALQTVTLRDPQIRSDDDPLNAKLKRTSPYLEGLTLGERLAVIFSPYDLSCALENQTSPECKGYLKVDAAKLGANVILFALQQ